MTKPSDHDLSTTLNLTRAATFREAADEMEADATRLAPKDPRAAEVLTAAAYLLRTRADEIAPTTT